MSVKVTVSKTGPEVMTEVMRQLHVRFNSRKHMDAVTEAAGAMLFDQFITETHAMASANPRAFHHVYEWEHIGDFGFQLFKPTMRGQGGRKSISWEWRASKTTVPTETDIEGNRKFPEWFDSSRLNRVHVFVWKAPIMEYGMTVHVRPKLSSVLVFPVSEGTGLRNRANSVGGVVFTSDPVTIPNPGGNEVQGSFTKWFVGWFGSRAPQVIQNTFERNRNDVFKASFRARMRPGSQTKRRRGKEMTLTINPDSAQKAKIIAQLIAGDLERNYIGQAQQRKRLINGG
jgi:hypothetical protein